MAPNASRAIEPYDVYSNTDDYNIIFRERLPRQNEVSDTGFHVVNHMGSEPVQSNTPAEPESETEGLRAYRQSLVGLLASNLESLARCERLCNGITENTNANGEAISESGLSVTEDEGHDDSLDCDDCDADDEDSDLASTATAPVGNNEPSSPPNSPTEPFPDYFESCETDLPLTDAEHEQAYNYAISKVVEEVIRFREIDSRLLETPNFLNEDDQSARTADSENENNNDNESSGENESDEDDEDISSNASSEGSLDSQDVQGNEVSSVLPVNERFSREDRNSYKLSALEAMRDMLNSPRLHMSVKTSFQELTNLVIQMEAALFRNWNDWHQGYLSAEDTNSIRLMATNITHYLAVVDSRLVDLLDVGRRVHHVLGVVSRDDDVNVFIRYRRMIHIMLG